MFFLRWAESSENSFIIQKIKTALFSPLSLRNESEMVRENTSAAFGLRLLLSETVETQQRE